MAVFSLACMLYTALCGFCLLEKRQRLILPKELQTKSLRSNWIYHGSHVGGDSTTATHTHKQGFVVATPGACASGSCLGGQLHHALVAQVDTDGIIAAHTGKLGSVVATPGASASHLPIGGSASTFAAQVDEDGAASTSTSRVGSVVATPFACASDRQLAGLALFTLATQVGEGYTTYVHRPGSVDATPRARSPGLHLAGQEVQTSVAQVWDDGASSAPQHRSGYVDATPGACTPGSCIKGQIVQALAAQVGADYTSITFACRPGSVDATPGVDAGRPAQATPKRLTKYRTYHASQPPFAKASWFVDATPDTPEKYAVTSPSRAAGSSALPVRVRSYTDVTWPTSASQHGIDSAAVAPKHYVRWTVEIQVLGSLDMSSSPKPVTAYLKRINELVRAAGPLPEADEWAPIFLGLDQAWDEAHKQELTTQNFLTTLSTFIMVQGQIPPSSREADHVREIARSVAKVRLGMRLNKGPSYGLERGTTMPEQAAGVRSTATSEAPLLAPAVDSLPPEERLAALEMAIANLEQAEPNEALGMILGTAETHPASESHGRALSCRGASVGLPPANFLQVTPPIRPGRSALRTAVGGEQHLSPPTLFHTGIVYLVVRGVG